MFLSPRPVSEASRNSRSSSHRRPIDLCRCPTTPVLGNLEDLANTKLIAGVLEVEYQARRVAEIILVRVCERIGKPRQQVVNFGWPQLNDVTHRDIDPSAKCHRKGIVRRRLLEIAGSSSYRRVADGLVSIAVHVGMGRSEQHVRERMNSVSPYLELRPEHICEQVAGRVTLSTIRETWKFRERESVRRALISLKVRLDAEILVDVDDKRAATSVETVALRVLSVRAKPREGVVHAQLKSRELLCPCR
jgi:hypothetical protein